MKGIPGRCITIHTDTSTEQHEGFMGNHKLFSITRVESAEQGAECKWRSDKLGLAESWKLRVTVTTSHSVSPPGPISEWYTAGISTPFYRAAVCFKGRMTGVLPLCGTLSIIHK